MAEIKQRTYHDETTINIMDKQSTLRVKGVIKSDATYKISTNLTTIQCGVKKVDRDQVLKRLSELINSMMDTLQADAREIQAAIDEEEGQTAIE